MGRKILKLLPFIFISLIPTLLIWMPFFFRMQNVMGVPLSQNGMATVVANYDGPLFLVVAKTFYNSDLIQSMFQFPLPTEYYAAHFPLFPLLIKPLAALTGFPYAMLTVTAISSVLALYFFYLLAKDYSDNETAYWMTLLFAIFPARWLIVRSVGSAEPLFVAAIIASVYFFNNKKYWWAGIWGAIAAFTKSPGILLFLAYLGAIIGPKIKSLAIVPFNKWIKSLDLHKVFPILLIPLSLAGVFTIYHFTMNDFFAYFNSGDNIHLFFPPFQIFDYSAPWVGTFWLEEIIFVYLLSAVGLVKLIKEKRIVESWFVAIFFVSILFVSHRDIIRYALPIVPFLLLAYMDTLGKKDYRFLLLLLIVPIYLFSLGFISNNVMPISNWSPFL